MGLSGMQQAQDISPLFQLVIQIAPTPRWGFNPNEDVTGYRIQLAQFFLPELPALPGIGKGNRFDYRAFVGPQNAARAGLARRLSIPQTYLIDSSSGENVDDAVFIVHLLSGHPLTCSLSTVGSEKPDQPGRASAHAGSAISPGGCLREKLSGGCNKPHRPLQP